MKILVFSDSHHALGNMYDAVMREKPDQILHLGDHYTDAEDLQSAFSNTAIQYVPGNCDYAYDLPSERLLILDGVRIFMTHGHRYYVKSGLEQLLYAATRQNADIALFGHTHIAHLETIDGITYLNPASCGIGTGTPGYGRILTNKGKFTCELVTICD